jgi:cyclic pyranopterin phosphate synthase
VNIKAGPRYLRISLLSACNLRCSYCKPDSKQLPSIVAPNAKVRSAIRFLHGFGINKIRFTGGEPTLYKSLSELVSFVKSMDGDIQTAVTSNGVLLKARAEELSTAGLDSINVSLDTLDSVKFRMLTSSGVLDNVISGIDAAARHIGNVKLNCVLIRDFNDKEADRLISFAENRGLDIRFIEFMPNRYSAPGDPRFVSGEEIRNQLPWDFRRLPGNPNSAARYYSASPLKIKIGFISPVSHPFCASCNRIRLTADGLLYNCLYDSTRLNLFDLLENDPERAQAEFEKLLRAKRFSGCNSSIHFAETLPSFSAIGG